MFTQREIEYLRSQPLARLATVSAGGQPDNAAVGFRVEDDGSIAITGMDLAASRKGRNVLGGQTRVALIVDDLESVQPWKPRGIRIYGTAELHGAEGDPPHGGQMVVSPDISWSWGLEGDPMAAGSFRPHRTVHDGG